jgi:hypothetical protein
MYHRPLEKSDGLSKRSIAALEGPRILAVGKVVGSVYPEPQGVWKGEGWW